MLGRYYKHVYEKNPPEHVLKQNNPDLLESWVKGSEGLKKQLGQFESGNLSIVGLTKEDRQVLGIKKHHMEDDVAKLLKEKKGDIRMIDYLKNIGEIKT